MHGLNSGATYNGQKVTYDEKGNMTYGPVDGVMQELTYDCRNRLVEAGGVSYTYDAENTRIATTEDGLTTEYVTDTGGSLSRLLIAYEADGTRTQYYYGAEGLAAQYNNGTKKYYAYHYDNIGSTTLITAGDGHAIERFSYGTYGELLKAPITKMRFLYNGSYGVATDSNGLYYMRARYYNPDIKRFINPDIKVGDIGNSQSLNRYAYCEGNPVSMVDPFGLCGEDANDQGKESKYESLHNVLDWGGFVFDPLDLINGALYVAEGDYVNAALCAVSFIPVAGSVIVGAVKGVKAIIKAKKAEKILSLAKESCKMMKNAANTLDTLTDTMKAAAKWGDNPLKLVDGITTEAGSKAMKALETGGDFAKESKKAVWEMKAVSGADGIRLKTSVDESVSFFKQGFAGTDGVAKSARNSNIVYRAVTPEQAKSIRAGNGIIKQKPYAKTTLTQHVGGVKHRKNPWTSTSRRRESAEYFSTHGGKNINNPNPIVRIDLSKIDANNIVDVSTIEKATQHLTRPFTVNAAAYHQEVLIYGDIPQEAIIDFVGGY